MKLKSKSTLVLLAGFIVGLVLFFPWNPLKEKVAKTASAATGAQLEIGSLSGSTGYMAGLTRGSVFGIKGSNVSIQHPFGINLRCNKIYIAPRILPLLIGSLQLGMKCKQKDNSSIAALVKVYPFWGVATGNIRGIDVSVSADAFSLALLANLPGAEGLTGKLTGDIDLSEMSPNGGMPEELQWEVEIDNLQTPPLDNGLAPLPPMSFSEASSEGRMTPRSLDIQKLSLGSKANPLEAHLKLEQIQLDSRMNPQKGSFHGAIRIDPEFEKQRLSKINWNSAFGKPDQNGKREFKRSAKGAWHTFLIFGAPD